MIPFLGRQKMIKFLVEFIAQLNERYPLPSAKVRETGGTSAQGSLHTSIELCRKATTLLYNLLQPQYWADLDVDLFPNVTEFVLAGDKTTATLAVDPEKEKQEDKFMTNIINTLQVVRIILNFKSDEWILKSIPQIQKILDKCLKSEHPEIQDCLHGSDIELDDGRDIRPIVKRILDAVPEDIPMEDADAEGEPEAPTSEVITFLSGVATESMAAGNYVSGINVLWSLGNRKPSAIDHHIAAIMKSLQAEAGQGPRRALCGPGTSGPRPTPDPGSRGNAANEAS